MINNQSILIRFYAELNDFLAHDRKFKPFTHTFSSHQTTKDIIESLGVPHSEVDLILVNGKSTDFEHRLENGDHVAVYPVFESIDIQPLIRLRPEPLRVARFVVDANLGRLARYLRMLGFDTAFGNAFNDAEIVRISLDEKRIILTRDQDLLKRKAVTHGYWVRSTQIMDQIKEVIDRLDLKTRITPFSRCLECNGLLSPVSKDEVIELLEEGTKRDFDVFYRCSGCEKVYWKGSHYQRMKKVVEGV